jgi:hypothetical protein
VNPIGRIACIGPLSGANASPAGPRILDADEMLEQAGLRTLTGQLAKASKQGPEALQAFYREWSID